MPPGTTWRRMAPLALLLAGCFQHDPYLGPGCENEPTDEDSPVSDEDVWEIIDLFLPSLVSWNRSANEPTSAFALTFEQSGSSGYFRSRCATTLDWTYYYSVPVQATVDIGDGAVRATTSTKLSAFDDSAAGLMISVAESAEVLDSWKEDAAEGDFDNLSDWRVQISGTAESLAIAVQAAFAQDDGSMSGLVSPWSGSAVAPDTTDTGGD